MPGTDHGLKQEGGAEKTGCCIVTSENIIKFVMWIRWIKIMA
jgi:hypothetical protein